MPRFDTGKVIRVMEEREGVARVVISIAGQERRATLYPRVTGPVAEGDRVVVNVTGVDLDLGTGGDDFVLWNLERAETDFASGGHILKLRYTPWQIDVVAAEASESPHHNVIAGVESLGGMPVVACGLHSQIASAAAVLKDASPALRIAYLMTDGAALPIAHSDLVAAMKKRGLLDATITSGHSFGGDFECVNVFSGLVVARAVCEADVTLVSMGPGIVGTGTPLGHTGMEQGQVLSAAGVLGGRPIASLRISFADPRPRHMVVSHHTLSALRFGALHRSTIAIPRLSDAQLQQVLAKLESAGIVERHDVQIVDSQSTLAALEKFDLSVTTMGRTVAQDPEFFQAAGAAGIVAAQMHAGQ